MLEDSKTLDILHESVRANSAFKFEAFQIKVSYHQEIKMGADIIQTLQAATS